MSVCVVCHVNAASYYASLKNEGKDMSVCVVCHVNMCHVCQCVLPNSKSMCGSC